MVSIQNLISYTTTLSNSTKAFRFIVKTNQVSNDNNRGRVVIGGFNILQINDPHTHNYTSIKKYNADYHKVIYYCGEYILDPHFLISIPFPIFGYDHLCLYCGEFIDVDEISQSSSPATLQTEYEYSKPPLKSASLSTIELYINKEDLYLLKF